ncbi:hypothetical protein Emtol_1015 [Sporocytophaga myxococcoides]|uniref:Uncharacterized protein n=1 Tax=Sporocytophaga myxococcoides TaxID=153721 RepID=A0A098LGH0_9BACT|nr:hypothetical protein [Sporocytophaga myxococcoides]GAL86081.1 hypothetical protein Emtol_1015 [Sporocytophaga myxococcoides]
MKTTTIVSVNEDLKNLKLYYIPLIFIFLCFSLPTVNFSIDMNYWASWSTSFLEYGIVKGYEMADCNYLPFYMYILKLNGWLQGTSAEIYRNINYLKIFTLLFDIMGIYVILQYLIKFNISPYKVFLVLFNISYLYNSIIWGQVDSIVTFFAFVSVFFALNERVSWTIVFFVLALNTKLQAIIFSPIIAIILIPQVFKNPKSLFVGLFWGLLIQLIIIWPFILENKLNLLWKIVFGSVGYYPVVSKNAFNVWYLFLEGNLMETSDELLFWGIKYKIWGFILFFFFSFLALVPLLITTIRLMIEKSEKTIEYYKIVFLTSALIPLVFFYFNTQMHERYCHPMVIFIATYALISSNYICYILLSIGYFLNLEKIVMSLMLKSYGTILFDNRFISFLFLLSLVYILFQLYSVLTLRHISNLKNMKLIFKAS